MDPNTLALTAAMLAGNYVVWGLKPGEYAYNLEQFSRKSYGRLRPIIMDLLGLGHNEVTIKQSLDQFGQLILEFNNIKATNFDQIGKKLEEQLKTKINFEEREDRLRGKESQLGNQEYYGIKLTAKDSAISLGNINDPTWSISDSFNVSITKGVSPAPLAENTDEYKRALTTFESSLKIAMRLSDREIDDTTKSALGGEEFLKFWHNFANKRIATSEAHNKTTRINESVILESDTIPHDAELKLKEYYETVKSHLKKEIETAEQTQKLLEKEVTERKRKSKTNKIKVAIKTVMSAPVFPIVAGTGITLAVLIIALALPLNIFIPGVYITFGAIKSVVNQILSIFNKNLVGILGLGTISIAFGILTKGVREYRLKKAAKENAEKTLQEVTEVIQELKGDLVNLETLQAGVKETLESIRLSSINPPGDGILDLSNKNIGDTEVAIVCHYLSNANYLSNCTGINFSGNKISTSGIRKLAATIKTLPPNSPLRTIKLAGISLDNEGREALRKAMRKNYSITELQLVSIITTNTEGNKVANEDIPINKELIINRSLQDQPLGNLVHASKNWWEKELLEVVSNKLESDFEITTSFSDINSDFKKLADKVVEQNQYLQKLSLSDTDLNSFVKNSSAAFLLDSKRACNFLRHKQYPNHTLMEKRNEIANLNSVGAKEKIDTLTMLDATTRNESYLSKLRIYQLEKLLPNTDIGDQQKLKEFIEIYGRVPEALLDDWLNVAKSLNKELLTTLITNYGLSGKTLDAKHYNKFANFYEEISGKKLPQDAAHDQSQLRIANELQCSKTTQITDSKNPPKKPTTTTNRSPKHSRSTTSFAGG